MTRYRVSWNGRSLDFATRIEANIFAEFLAVRATVSVLPY